MSEYKLPSGLAVVETEGGPMSEINYRYPVGLKTKILEEALLECWKMKDETETVAGTLMKVHAKDKSQLLARYLGKNKELEAKVAKLEKENNHYYDALVRLGDGEFLIDVKPFWNQDNGLEAHMDMEHFARIEYAQNALEGVSDEYL
jgi:hypothetical protein